MTHDLGALRSSWRGCDRFVLLHVAADPCAALLRVWQAWREDPQRPAQLDLIGISITIGDASDLLNRHRGSPLLPALAAQWPPHTPNLHRLAFEDGRLRWLLAVGPVLACLQALQAPVDACWLDSPDLSADPQRGAQRLGKALARLVVPLAQVSVSTHPPALRDGLAAAGFEILATAPGGAPRLQAVYRPRFKPRRARPAAARGERHALIVGAGLAGCAMAYALAEQGWRSTLIDRHAAPAQEASGNPAGLFHGVVNPQDGTHARFNRAAALQARLAVQLAIADHGALGSIDGLLRLETALGSVQAMRDLLQRLHLPASYVQALDATAASALCSLPLAHPAWFYPGGGWVQPAALARSYLQRAGTCIDFRGGLTVASLQACDGGWQLRNATGQSIAEGRTLVLANAADALRLLDAAHWPLRTVRGQISMLSPDVATPGLQLPRLPVAGAGYLLPPAGGLAVFGASSQPGDPDARVRLADHVFNLQRLQQLSPQAFDDVGALQGRVGWRCVADDRLPLVGAVPDETAMVQRRVERLRDMPRREGLYLFTALGSRGIAWSALGSQVLAAQIAGAPVPLETQLLWALDPARFALRVSRRSS